MVNGSSLIFDNFTMAGDTFVMTHSDILASGCDVLKEQMLIGIFMILLCYAMMTFFDSIRGWSDSASYKWVVKMGFNVASGVLCCFSVMLVYFAFNEGLMSVGWKVVYSILGACMVVIKLRNWRKGVDKDGE